MPVSSFCSFLVVRAAFLRVLFFLALILPSRCLSPHFPRRLRQSDSLRFLNRIRCRLRISISSRTALGVPGISHLIAAFALLTFCFFMTSPFLLLIFSHFRAASVPRPADKTLKKNNSLNATRRKPKRRNKSEVWCEKRLWEGRRHRSFFPSKSRGVFPARLRFPTSTKQKHLGSNSVGLTSPVPGAANRSRDDIEGWPQVGQLRDGFADPQPVSLASGRVGFRANRENWLP